MSATPEQHPTYDILRDVVVTLLLPFFLPFTDNDPYIARIAATQAVLSYRAESWNDLLTIMQIIATGFAATVSLGVSVDPDLPDAQASRLRANGAGLDRAHRSHVRRLRADQKARAARRAALAKSPAEAPAAPEEPRVEPAAAPSAPASAAASPAAASPAPSPLAAMTPQARVRFADAIAEAARLATPDLNPTRPGLRGTTPGAVAHDRPTAPIPTTQAHRNAAVRPGEPGAASRA